MPKLLVLLLASLMATPVLAWDDVYKDSNRYDKDNTPKSYTLSGDSYRNRKDSQEDSYSKPTRESNDNSRGTAGAYRNGNQINNNGLIINRE